MALTKKREIIRRKLAAVSHPVAAGAVIHEGAMTVLNAAGFAQPGTEAEGLTSVGRAESSVDNTGGTDGGANVTTRIDDACRYDNDAVAPVTRTSIMKPCFIKDDATVSSDATGRSAAGTVVNVDADGVWIAFI